MNRIVATLVATIALLFSGVAVTALPAAALQHQTQPECDPLQEGCQTQPEPCEAANNYRAQASALVTQVAQEKARADRAERRSVRQAATIQRLRAKLRAARG